MDSNEVPAFGYPMLRYDEDEEHQSPSKWHQIKNQLSPLKNLMSKHKKTDDAFDIIMKSFTYGRRLMRKKMSRA